MIRRGLRKPLPVIWARLCQELRQEADRVALPLRARTLTPNRLLQELKASSFDDLWNNLASLPCPAWLPDEAAEDQAKTICPHDSPRIIEAAERALRHEVALLGMTSQELGGEIDWHRDYKSGTRFAPRFYRNIDYTELGKPSDVKICWEISRLQWLIPAGQAYLLTRDDRYATGVRQVLDQWIDANPYGASVNWTCTMEVALRVLSWTWLFHACQAAPSWRDPAFRHRFLIALYLHGEFIEGHLEKSDVNGNHYTADAAGLVFAGLFFGAARKPQRWAALGWQILSDELPRQATPDGVDFEASVPYHRLVLELFMLPALYRLRRGLSVDAFYRERLVAMAQFTQACSREDGSVPLWGDADDARALPFGGQPINDHRYLPAAVGLSLDEPALIAAPGIATAELLWLFGPKQAAQVSKSVASALHSKAFPDGGFFIMRDEADHVFIDCGPIGLAGRGGHGHNDCLAFEAMLDGISLVSDCGAYAYTSSVEWRNHFRSTAQHNTPQIAGEEMNRFIRADYLWNMHYDAVPEVRLWQSDSDRDIFVGAHHGYRRLAPPVTPVRTIMLDKKRHALVVEDRFEGSSSHPVRIPFHFRPEVAVELMTPGQWRLTAGGKTYFLVAADDQWTADIATAWVSPSYGIKEPAKVLVFTSTDLRPLRVAIIPITAVPTEAHDWLRQLSLA